jgi:hypothetical protein
MERLFSAGGCGNRVHFKAAGVEGPTEPTDHTSFAGSIPAFQHDDRALRSAEIRLLHMLQDLLHTRYATLVIGKLHHRKVFDGGEPRVLRDDEVGRFHQIRPVAGCQKLQASTTPAHLIETPRPQA